MLMNRHERLLSIVEGRARLLAGGLVIFPTDTVWTVGARWKNAKAVNRLYEAKQRSIEKPFGLLAGSLTDLEELELNFDALHPNQHHAMTRLMKAFWPGTVSIVLPWPNKPLHCLWPQDTLSIRIPHHPVAQELLRHTGPLLHSSANANGDHAPTTYEAIDSGFLQQTSGVVAGEAGGEMTSTIVDLTQGDRPKVLRAGSVPMFEIEKILAS